MRLIPLLILFILTLTIILSISGFIAYQWWSVVENILKYRWDIEFSSSTSVTIITVATMLQCRYAWNIIDKLQRKK